MSGQEAHEAYRYDADGNLTVWGARDALEEIALGERMAGLHGTLVFTRELKRALDDVEDAVMRTHDAFGCGNEPGRYLCAACREARATGERVAAELTAEKIARTADHENEAESDDIAVGNVTFTVPVYARRADIARATSGLSESLVPARTSGEHVTVVPPDHFDEMMRDDDKDRAIREAAVSRWNAVAVNGEGEWFAVNSRGQRTNLADVADVAGESTHRRPEDVKRRIRDGLPPEPAEGWDAVADVRCDRDADAARDDARDAETSDVADVIDEIGD